ncbi:zf-HC2 domain-containing protein [Photorhabdus sp. SF281]|uniref:zf-HC2 domain-containing protein n=1 Tax=Photorhabdus sp. SF281 TaxID=3459527 RepID=UPI00404422B4
MLSCSQATRLMSQAQDEKIMLSQRVQLMLHLRMCDGCRNFRQQLADLRTITSAFARGENENQNKE